MDEAALEAFRRLVELLLGYFTPQQIIYILAGGLVAAFIFRIYGDWRRERGWKVALNEKERTVQRLEDRDREWRMLFAVSGLDLNIRTAEKIIVENNYDVSDRPAKKREVGGGRGTKKPKKS